MASRADKDIKIVFTGNSEDLVAAERRVETALARYGISIDRVNSKTDGSVESATTLANRYRALGLSVQDVQDRVARSIGGVKTSVNMHGKLQNAVSLTARQYAALDKEMQSAGVTLSGITQRQQVAATNQRLQIANVLKYSLLYGGAALAISKVADALGSVVARGVELEGTKAVFQSAFGGADEAARQLEFVTDVAHRYSLEISEMRVQYRKFAASATLSGATLTEVQGIYENMSKAARGLHLSNDDLGGAFRAITQIFSKGKVQAEELRGQLGERLPGAMAIMARSVGVSTARLNKMMEQGNLTSEAMSGFAKAYADTISAEGLEASLQSVQALTVGVTNSWDEFSTTLFEKTSPAIKTLLTGLREVTEWGTHFVESVGFDILVAAIKAVGIVLTASLIVKMGVAAIAIGRTAAAMVGLTTATTANTAATIANGVATAGTTVAGGKLNKVLGVMGGKKGLVMAVVLATYLYRKELGELLGVWDKADEAASRHADTLDRVRNKINRVITATKAQMAVTSSAVKGTLEKAKAERQEANRAHEDALVSLARYKKVLSDPLKSAEFSIGSILKDAVFGDTELKKLEESVVLTGKVYSETQKQVEVLKGEVTKLGIEEAARNVILKRANIIVGEGNAGEEAAIQAEKKRVEATEAANLAGIKYIKSLERKNALQRGDALTALKLSATYQKMTPKFQKLAEAQTKINMAYKASAKGVRGLTAAEKALQKTRKEAATAGKKKIAEQDRMIELIRKETIAIKLKTAMINKNEIAAYKLFLDSKKIYGQARKDLILLKKQQIEAKKAFTLRKAEDSARKKAVALLEKHRTESEAYGNTVNNIIPAIAALTREENKLNAAYLRKTKANKLLAKHDKAAAKTIEELKDKQYELRDSLGLVTKAEKQANLERTLGLHVLDEEYLRLKRNNKVLEERAKNMEISSKLIEGLLEKALPGFNDLGGHIGDVSDAFAKLLDGQGSIGDVFSNLDNFTAPGKGSGINSAVTNGASGYSLAQSMGLGERAAIGAAIYGTAATLAGLPPQLGQVFGAFIGKMTEVFRKGARIRFDQSFTGDEGAYDRDLASYERKGITRETDFGVFGVSDETRKYGRAQEEHKRAVQIMLDSAEAADNLMIKLLTDSQVDRASATLDGANIRFGNNSGDSETFLSTRLNTQIAEMDKELQALIPSTATYTEKLAILQTIADASESWARPLQAYGLNLGNTSSQIVAATVGLVEAAGGAENLSSLLQNYASKMLTPWEQLELRQDIATSSINEYNDQLAEEGHARITSSAELKTYIEHLRKSGKLNTKAGQEALANALNIVNAYAEFDKVAEDQETYIQAQKDEAQAKLDAQLQAGRAQIKAVETERDAKIAAIETINEQTKKELEIWEERDVALKGLYATNLEAADGIHILAGGIKELRNITKTYAETVFSTEEQEAIAQANAGKKLRDLAEQLGVEANSIDTREELRAMVEKLNNAEGAMTEERKAQLLATLQAAGAAALLEDANLSAAGALSALPDELREVVGGFNDTIEPLHEMGTELQAATTALENSAEAIRLIEQNAVDAIDAIQAGLDALTLPDTNVNILETQVKTIEKLDKLSQLSDKQLAQNKASTLILAHLKETSIEANKLTIENQELLQLLAQIKEEAASNA